MRSAVAGTTGTSTCIDLNEDLQGDLWDQVSLECLVLPPVLWRPSDLPNPRVPAGLICRLLRWLLADPSLRASGKEEEEED